ncbi:MAG: cation:dicarboxylase symporter family transporter, partial [Legionellales bacterium]|nr:cation:dicarboxylase symporter family transporter [Legionellales bacterium]
LILPVILLSNFITTLTSVLLSSSIINNKFVSINSFNFISKLSPSINVTLPKIVSNEKMLFLGLLVGLVFSCVSQNISKKISAILDKYVNIFLYKIFIPIIPLFIFGFILKLQYDEMLYISVKNYAAIFALIIIFQITYVSLLYGIASKFNISNFLRFIKNIIPAGVTGFITMSSIASLPLTLVASEKNINNSDFPKLIIPATVNVHLIGDCIAIPIFALAILKTFGLPIPNIESLLIFVVYFVIAKFAVASVPGGGILVMLPILEKYMGFTPVMLSLITALYIMLDCVTTSINVIGNGAFTILFYKIYNKILINRNTMIKSPKLN